MDRLRQKRVTIVRNLGRGGGMCQNLPFLVPEDLALFGVDTPEALEAKIQRYLDLCPVDHYREILDSFLNTGNVSLENLSKRRSDYLVRSNKKMSERTLLRHEIKAIELLVAMMERTESLPSTRRQVLSPSEGLSAAQKSSKDVTQELAAGQEHILQLQQENYQLRTLLRSIKDQLQAV